MENVWISLWSTGDNATRRLGEALKQKFAAHFLFDGTRVQPGDTADPALYVCC